MVQHYHHHHYQRMPIPYRNVGWNQMPIHESNNMPLMFNQNLFHQYHRNQNEIEILTRLHPDNVVYSTVDNKGYYYNRAYYNKDYYKDLREDLSPEPFSKPFVRPKMNRPELPADSLARRPKTPKKIVIHLPPLRLREDKLHSLLQIFQIMPEKLLRHGYPERTHGNRAHIFKPSFQKGLYYGQRPKAEKEEAEAIEKTTVYERNCVRCNRPFLTTDKKYITKESCVYHYGKNVKRIYSCCGGAYGSPGCSSCDHHVWNGTVPGRNEDLEGFVETQPAKTLGKMRKVYALDCEMSYTVKGLVLTRVAILACNGHVIYDTFVKPEDPIVDYNTRFSGVSETDIFENPKVKEFLEVQRDVLDIVSEDTILIGHALENDLRCMKIIHRNVVDTSLLFPHKFGHPFKISLKYLMKRLLNKDIQTSTFGHSPCEDALSCLQLVDLHLKSLRFGEFL